jgi:AcrR family transcriptional regulator
MAVSTSRITPHEKQVARTKNWIFEALMFLLESEPYEKISISEICEKAGVARSSFYRNFTGKDDIILQYLRVILTDCMLKIVRLKKRDKKQTFSLTLPVLQIAGQAGNLKKLFDHGLSFLLLRYFEDWIDAMISQCAKNLSKREALVFRYTVTFLTGGVLSTIVDWIKHDLPINETELKGFLEELFQPLSSKYSDILNILVEYT